MKNAVKLLVCLFISSCAFMGSKTLYKSETPFEFKRIGYVHLFYKEQLDSIHKGTDSLLFASVNQEFKKNLNDSLIFIDAKIANANAIVSLCEQYNLNGIIIPQLVFINSSYSMYFIPIAHYVDTDVKLSLYNAQGKSIITTEHNTSPVNIYKSNPNARTSTQDGGVAAMKKLLKDFGLLLKKH